jgi:hypothetical protein
MRAERQNRNQIASGCGEHRGAGKWQARVSRSDQRETLEELKDESMGFPEMHSDFTRRRLVDACVSADTGYR